MGLPLRILMIEDNTADVALMRAALYESGVPHVMEVMRDGEEALELIVNNMEANRRPPPDVILLDLNLPKIHGFEVLTAIRQSRCVAKCPVVVLSSSQEPTDVTRAYELQANAYVLKPSHLPQVFSLARGIAFFWSLNVSYSSPLPSAL